MAEIIHNRLHLSLPPLPPRLPFLLHKVNQELDPTRESLTRSNCQHGSCQRHQLQSEMRQQEALHQHAVHHPPEEMYSPQIFLSTRGRVWRNN